MAFSPIRIHCGGSTKPTAPQDSSIPIGTLEQSSNVDAVDFPNISARTSIELTNEKEELSIGLTRQRRPFEEDRESAPVQRRYSKYRWHGIHEAPKHISIGLTIGKSGTFMEFH